MRRRAAVAVLTAAALTVIAAPAASAQPLMQVDRPGIYVQEIGSQQSITGVDVAVPLVVGGGTAASDEPSRGLNGRPFVVSSLADFQAEVVDPSPRLAAGVAAFFALNDASPLLLDLTPDESPSTLAAAVSEASTADGYGLVTVPALGQLSGADYLTVATAMDQAAQTRGAVALLDPPDAAVEQAVAQGVSTPGARPDVVDAAAARSAAPLSALAEQLDEQLPAPGSAMLFSSGLTDAQQRVVPAALAVAGLIGSNAQTRGVWTPAGGLSEPLTGLAPVWPVPNAAMGVLGAAKINPLRSMPGDGTVLWGYDTLSAPPGQPASTDAGQRMLVNQIDQSVTAALVQYIFAANDATTWTEITQSVTAYLGEQWQSGALYGASAADAFTVSCGVPVTMTDQDVLQGTLRLVIRMQTTAEAAPVTLSLTQTMAGS